MPFKLIKRPPSPYWIIRGSANGQRLEQSTRTTDKSQAEAIRIKFENDILTRQVFGERAVVTFAEAVLSYMNDNGEERFLLPLLDHFRETPLSKINQSAINVAARKLYPRAAPATLNRQVYTPMSAILRHAGPEQVEQFTIKRPKQPKQKPIRWLQVDEAWRLIGAAAPHLRPLLIFMFYTGARCGEAIYLDWRQVDLDRGHVTFIKTKNSEPRGVPLHPVVVSELRKSNRRKGPVFLTHKGKPYAKPDKDNDQDTSAGTRIKSAFRTACTKAEIANFTPHGCRHTWATWHYIANRDVNALKELGGWKSLDMVMRYTHVSKEHLAPSIKNLPTGGILGE